MVLNNKDSRLLSINKIIICFERLAFYLGCQVKLKVTWLLTLLRIRLCEIFILLNYLLTLKVWWYLREIDCLMEILSSLKRKISLVMRFYRWTEWLELLICFYFLLLSNWHLSNQTIVCSNINFWSIMLIFAIVRIRIH